MAEKKTLMPENKGIKRRASILKGFVDQMTRQPGFQSLGSLAGKKNTGPKRMKAPKR